MCPTRTILCWNFSPFHRCQCACFYIVSISLQAGFLSAGSYRVESRLARSPGHRRALGCHQPAASRYQLPSGPCESIVGNPPLPRPFQSPSSRLSNSSASSAARGIRFLLLPDLHHALCSYSASLNPSINGGFCFLLNHLQGITHNYLFPRSHVSGKASLALRVAK